MATVPKEIQEGLKDLAKKLDTSTKELMDRMKTIMEEDTTMPNETDADKEWKIRFAWAVLLNEISSKGNAVDCLIMPIMTPTANERKIKGDMTWVGDCTALIQTIGKNEAGDVEKGDVQYAHGTFWRDGAKNLQKMKKGKVYKAALLVNENKSGWGVSITSDRAVFIETDEKMLDFGEFFKEEIKSRDITIGLGELDINKSDDNTDIRIVRATIIDANIGESKNGGTYGFYVITDNTIIGSNQRLFVAPEDVCWRIGSIMYFGGTIDIINKDTGETKFKVQFIQPTELALPQDYSIKPVSKSMPESVDLDAEEKKQKQESGDKKDKEEGEIFSI